MAKPIRIIKIFRFALRGLKLESFCEFSRWPISKLSPAPFALVARAAPTRLRNALERRATGFAAVRPRGKKIAPRNFRDARRVSIFAGRTFARSDRRPQTRRSRSFAFWNPRKKRRAGCRRVCQKGNRAANRPAVEKKSTGIARHHGRLFVRIYGARTLRNCCERKNFERRDFENSRANGIEPCGSGRRFNRAERHDGWSRGGDSRRAG